MATKPDLEETEESQSNLIFQLLRHKVSLLPLDDEVDDDHVDDHVNEHGDDDGLSKQPNITNF